MSRMPNNPDDEQRNKVYDLLYKYDQDMQRAIEALFGGSCSYKTARQLSVSFAKHFGLSEADFMRYYRWWRKGVRAPAQWR